jgi:hypothetical protein
MQQRADEQEALLSGLKAKEQVSPLLALAASPIHQL